MPTWDERKRRSNIKRNDDFHVISLRRAEKHEARYYFEATKAFR